MPTFRYSAYKAAGSSTSGTIEAESLRDARLRLKKEGLFAREITLDGADGGKSRFKLRKGVSLADLSLLTRRLAILLASAVPVYEAVNTLQEQERPGELKNILSRIRERLKEGSGLAKALAEEPNVFNESYTAMVAAGEASGTLETILDRLADFLEDQASIRSKIATALAYPILMMFVGSGVMLFLLTFVIPKIVVIFDQSKATLPLITLIVMSVSRFMQHWWWALVIAGCGLALLYNSFRDRPGFLEWRDRFLLKLPLIGPLIGKLALARLGRALGLLLAGGVPVIKALEIASEVVSNRSYRAVLNRVKGELIEGGRLSSGLAGSPLFPPLIVHMIAVGEKSGELEQMLTRVGAAFEKEFETSITRSMALLEPLMVLGMGLAVAVVVVAVILPIVQMNQLIR